MTISIHKDDILYEITEMIKDREVQFAHFVKTEQMSKDVARKRYNAMRRAKEIVTQYYKRIEEDMKHTPKLRSNSLFEFDLKRIFDNPYLPH